MNFLLATLCLSLFCILGLFDGVYFHLLKFELHRRRESRTEHLIHTARAFFFFPIALLLFAFNTGGAFLLFGLAMVAADLVLEVFDILIEKRSREAIGGISSVESAVHVFASSFRMAALAFVISAKPAVAFALGAPLFLGESYPQSLQVLGLGFAAFSLLGGTLSLVAIPRVAR
jgi:hypothetical protein